MIADSLDQIHIYKGIMSSLDTAIDFLLHNDLSTLPLGKTVIDEDTYVMIFDNVLTDGAINAFEFHRDYGDLHVTLNDQEWVHCTTLDHLSMTKSYDKDGDYGLGTATHYASILIDPVHFVAVFPNDAHSVKNYAGTANIKKAVLKFKIQGK